MSRQGLMDDSGYDFFDASDCANYESCREEAYNDGYADAIDEMLSKLYITWLFRRDEAKAYREEIDYIAQQLKEQNK